MAGLTSPNPGKISFAHKMALRGEPNTPRSEWPTCTVLSPKCLVIHQQDLLTVLDQGRKRDLVIHINYLSCAMFYNKC